MGIENCKIRQFALVLPIILFLFSSVCVLAQTEPDKSARSNQNPNVIDENFDLRIRQERIAEKDFKRATNVELTTTDYNSANRDSGLRLEVGVGVRARNIDVTLRGITGKIRFRASLEALRRRLEKLQTTVDSAEQTP